MKTTQKLKNLLISEIIPDLEDAIDELFSIIEKNKIASTKDREELKELQEMHKECKDIVKEIDNCEIDEDEAKELLIELIDIKTLSITPP